MSNWQYYNDTGREGGILNPSDATIYVDSYSGDDANNGSYDSPVKSLQQALDYEEVYLSGISNIVVAGYYNEGDFIGNHDVRIIPQGYVVMDGTGGFSFQAATMYLGTIEDYGRICFKDFVFRVGSNKSSAAINNIYNCDFLNCIAISTKLFSETITILGSYFKDSIFGNYQVGTRTAICIIQNNTFVNTILNNNLNIQEGSLFLRNNYFDETSKLDFHSSDTNQIDNGAFNYNHFRGTLPNKIYLGGANYDNIEDLRTAKPQYAINDIASTTDPLFNFVNQYDYTLQDISPILKAGVDGGYIGASGVARAVGASSPVWTVTGIDNTTVAGEAVLTASPVGTMTSSAIQVYSSKKTLTRINLPNFEQNPFLGEVIGANLSSDVIPLLMDIEIQYGDDGVVFNGTWLKVPVGARPYHDIVNDVGNDDDLFDPTSASPINCVYVIIRITLRDNETPI